MHAKKRLYMFGLFQNFNGGRPANFVGTAPYYIIHRWTAIAYCPKAVQVPASIVRTVWENNYALSNIFAETALCVDALGLPTQRHIKNLRPGCVGSAVIRRRPHRIGRLREARLDGIFDVVPQANADHG